MTERDLAIVRWIGRQRFAEAGQIACRFGMGDRKAYHRLRGLVGVGLLDRRRILHCEPGAYWAPRAGLSAADLGLPVAGIDIRSYHHDRLATDVMIDLEQEFGPGPILTERELRSRDTTAESPRYSARLASDGSGRRGLHFPDLAVDGSDGRALAVEVELTAKGRRRLEAIVAGYVRARHIAEVRYYVSSSARPGLERAIERAQASALFDLRPLETSRR